MFILLICCCQKCSNNSYETIKILIQNGADITLKNYDDKSIFFTLKRFKENYHKYVVIMVKVYSKLSVENIPIGKADMDFIKANPVTLKYFEDCKEELEQMAGTKFYASCTYYDVLKMSKNI